VVVSSDKEVQRAAVKAGASILSTPEFEREVGKILDREADEPLESGRDMRRKGDAFQVPREKKRAYFLLRKYQKS